MPWVEKVNKCSKLMNSFEVIKWSSNKTYLKELRDAGVAIAPTIFIEQGEKVNITQLMKEKNWENGMIKPLIGQTARETCKFNLEPDSLKEA